MARGDDAAIRHVVETQPEGVMAMVRRGYAQVMRPRHAAMVDVVAEAGCIAPRVHLVGPDGRPDSTWRIGGCTLEAMRDLAG